MGAGQMSRLGTEAARIEQLIAAKRDTAWRLLCVAAVGVLAFVVFYVTRYAAWGAE